MDLEDGRAEGDRGTNLYVPPYATTPTPARYGWSNRHPSGYMRSSQYLSNLESDNTPVASHSADAHKASFRRLDLRRIVGNEAAALFEPSIQRRHTESSPAGIGEPRLYGKPTPLADAEQDPPRSAARNSHMHQIQASMVMGIDSESSSNVIDLTQEDQMELDEDTNTSPSPSWSAPANDYLRQVATKALDLLPHFATVEEPYQEQYGNRSQDQPEGSRHIAQETPALEVQNLGGGAQSLASSYTIAPATSTSVLHLPDTDLQAVDHGQADKEIPKGDNENNLRPNAPPQTTFAPPRKRPITMDQEPEAKRSKLSNPGPSATQSPQTNLGRHSAVYKKQLEEARIKLAEHKEKLQYNKHGIDKRDKELQVMLMQADMEKLMVLLKAQLQCDAAHGPGQSGKVELGLSTLETMPHSNGCFGPLPRPCVFMLRQLKKLRAELQDLETQLDAKARKTTSYEMVDDIKRAVDLRFFIQEFEGRYKADREREEDIRRKREDIERQDVSSTGSYQQAQPLAMPSPTHSAAESSTSRSASIFSDTQSDASFGEHVRGSSKPSLPTIPEQSANPQASVGGSNAYAGSDSGQRRSQRLRKVSPH